MNIAGGIAIAAGSLAALGGVVGGGMGLARANDGDASAKNLDSAQTAGIVAAVGIAGAIGLGIATHRIDDEFPQLILGFLTAVSGSVGMSAAGSAGALYGAHLLST